MNPAATSNINHLWAHLLVEELVRSGVRCFCLSPGSRSTPLVAALASRKDIEKTVHYDERGSAFYALGYARATGRPAAWVTTSGTAVANGLPAVIEAAQSRLPLLLLTADRPPELRDAGANQAIEQPHLFGPYVRWHVDMPCPTQDISPSYVLSTASQAVFSSLRAPQGPVHLNCMFREPVAPTDDGHDYTAYLAPLKGWLESAAPQGRRALPHVRATEHDMEEALACLGSAERGLLVVGQLSRPEESAAVAALAVRWGWPVLADVGSGLRLGRQGESCIAQHDLLLNSSTFCASHRPDAVLHVGGPLVAKRVTDFLHAARPSTYVQVKSHPQREDPDHQVTLSIECELVPFCQEAAEAPQRPSASWLQSWTDGSTTAAQVIDELLMVDTGLSEPMVARLVSRYTPEGHALFAASSMPVRDMQTFASGAGAGLSVAANRGASGIDGTVATAFGYAAGLHRPTTLVIGDLALLHDLNSLRYAVDASQPAVLVVLNNDGGGIFHFLPIAEHEESFETYFGTPHGLTFEGAAGMFGLDYHSPRDQAEFVAAYEAAVGGNRSAVIEVRTDRRENLDLHRRIEKAVARALEA